ncbi:MAG: hypothetical protein L0338_11425 [Acidobacteria bacterium]|nr:hypothetical protein [Acidobacteriota bacterium]
MKTRFRKLSAARCVVALLAILCVLTGALTRQWLRRNTLVNPPSYDALVYQNQSYDDLYLIEKAGWTGYIKKYTNGSWHVPPLYVTLATATHLLFGLDPANAYLVNTPFLFAFCWGSFLLFRYAGARDWAALLAAGLVSFSPATISFALRRFMPDYAAAAAYVWATAVLLQSHRLQRRRAVLLYGAIVSISLLLKSSLAIYYLPQAMLIAAWLLSRKTGDQSSRRWANLARAAGLVVVMTGWFYAPNLPQIFSYYFGWAGSTSSITKTAAGIGSTADSLLFYYRNVAQFHFAGVGARWIWGSLAFIAALAMLGRWRTRVGWKNERTAALLILLAGQYVVLAAYPSKVNVVDFSVVPFYFLVPVSYAFSRPRWAGRRSWKTMGVVVALVVLSALTLRQSVAVLSRPAPEDERQDWKVKETLGEILQHAEKTGLRQLVVGSTPVHPYYTCENLRFYVLNGTFPDWREGFRMAVIGRAASAEELFSFVRTSDYVVTIDGWQGPSQLPNNHWAPQVNQWLSEGQRGFSLLYERAIPKGSRVKVYTRNDHLTYDPVQADGWAIAGMRVTVSSSRPSVRIRVRGQIPLPPALAYPVELYLTDEDGRTISNGYSVHDDTPFEALFEVALQPEGKGTAKLQINSNRIFSPAAYGVNTDSRSLMLKVTSISLDY